jgi:hypothetical protein
MNIHIHYKYPLFTFTNNAQRTEIMRGKSLIYMRSTDIYPKAYFKLGIQGILNYCVISDKAIKKSYLLYIQEDH